MTLRRAIVFVVDLPRMVAFYRDEIGLAVIAEEDGWVELDGVALHAIPPAIAARITIASPPVAREDTAIKLVFARDGLDAARDIVDPEGNVLQLVPAR